MVFVMVRPLGQTQQSTVCCIIAATAGEIIKGVFGDADDMVANKFGAFACPVFGMFKGTFPFQHGPAIKIKGRQFGKDGTKIDLPVTKRAKTPGPDNPNKRLVARWG